MPDGKQWIACGLDLVEQLDPVDGGRYSRECDGPGEGNLTLDCTERVVIAILGWRGWTAVPAMTRKTGTDDEVRILEGACR
jgi:hypothetical protein